MMSLLEAVEAGRLIELPDNDKGHAIQILGSLIEAIPDLQANIDVVGKVGERERMANSGIGAGWACPHARIAAEGGLQCAVGWTPKGIDYGAPDGKPVYVIVMYLIPENQKNAYLKEISTLARLIQANESLRTFSTLADLNQVRNRFLDAITAALESSAPQTKARMIRLESRQLAGPAAPAAPGATPTWMPGVILPFAAVCASSRPPLILAQEESLVRGLEATADLTNLLSRQEQFSAAGYRILVRSATSYKPDRTYWECLAVKEPAPLAAPGTAAPAGTGGTATGTFAPPVVATPAPAPASATPGK